MRRGADGVWRPDGLDDTIAGELAELVGPHHRPLRSVRVEGMRDAPGGALRFTTLGSLRGTGAIAPGATFAWEPRWQGAPVVFRELTVSSDDAPHFTVRELSFGGRHLISREPPALFFSPGCPLVGGRTYNDALRHEHHALVLERGHLVRLVVRSVAGDERPITATLRFDPAPRRPA